MRRRTYLVGCSTALTAGLAGCADSSEDPTDGSPTSSDPGTENPTETDTRDDGTGDGSAALTNPSFEDDLSGWTVGKDLPDVPGEDGQTVDHGTEVVSERASDGEQAVEFYVSGVADDGTIWVEQTVDFSGVEAMAVDVYSEMRSANVLSEVAFFAGEKPDGGLTETDFDRDEDVQDHEGWKTYQYSVADRSGTGTVAIGMNVIWETDVYGYFDNVRSVEATDGSETTSES